MCVSLYNMVSVCPGDMEYTDCAAACQPSCHYNSPAAEDCDQACEPGCVCPGHKVLDEDGKCVEPIDCACRDEDGNRMNVSLLYGDTWNIYSSKIGRIPVYDISITDCVLLSKNLPVMLVLMEV